MTKFTKRTIRKLRADYKALNGHVPIGWQTRKAKRLGMSEGMLSLIVKGERRKEG